MAQRPINRATPRLPVQSMQTHHILAPLGSHWQKATCEEIDCADWREGYGVPLKTLDAEDLDLLELFIKTHKMKAAKVEIKNGERHYWFEPGQRCLRASTHMRRLEREEIFLVRDGDWRGAPKDRDPIVFSGPDAFVDHLGTHLEKIGE